jgi:hypothetical protein
MSKSTGNWKPLPPITNEPLPIRGTTVIGSGPHGTFGVPADIVLPISPYTLQIVEEEEKE